MLLNRNKYVHIKFSYRKLNVKVLIKVVVFYDREMSSNFKYRPNRFSRWQESHPITNLLWGGTRYVDFNRVNIKVACDEAIKLIISDYRNARSKRNTKVRILKLKKELRGK